MSLLDWFAGNAIVGGLVRHRPGEGVQYEEFNAHKPDHANAVAEEAYIIATAMLAERDRLAAIASATGKGGEK